METKRLCARYANSHGVAVAIVAVVNYYQNELFDWAVYWGSSTQTYRQEDCVKDVADFGEKLLSEDAAYFFPGLDITRYRE